MTYLWNLGNGVTKTTTTPTLDYTYTKVGAYKVSVDVKDDKGASSKSDVVSLYAGNETPVVKINITGGNKSFYLPGVPVKYNVQVTDKNDPSKIDPNNLFVTVDYVQGTDKAASATGHQQGVNILEGKNIMLSLDCKSCHKENEKSIGPAYVQVSQKYQNNRDAMAHLTQKIIKGGAGVWGEVAMPAHPGLSQGDAQQIVTWVLSLANTKTAKKSLPQSGTITPPAAAATTSSITATPAPLMVLTASYTDKGGKNIKALTGTGSTALRSNTMTFTGSEKVKGFTTRSNAGRSFLLFPASNEGWFSVDNIDLTDVASISLNSGWQGTPKSGFSFEARLDGPDGKVLGTGSMPAPEKGQQSGVVTLPIQMVSDGKFHSIYMIYKAQETFGGGIFSIKFNPK